MGGSSSQPNNCDEQINELKDYKDKYFQTNDELKKTSNSLELMRKEATECATRLSKLDTKVVERLNRDIESYKQEIAKLESKNDEYKAKIKTLTRPEILESSKKIEELKTRFKELHNEYMEYSKHKCDKENKAIESLNKRNAELVAQIAKYDQNSKYSDANYQAKIKQINTLTENLNNLQTSYNLLSDELAATKANQVKAESEKVDVEAENLKYKDRLSSIREYVKSKLETPTNKIDSSAKLK